MNCYLLIALVGKFGGSKMKTLTSFSKLVIIIFSLSIISAREIPKPLAAEPSTVTVTCNPTSVPYTGSRTYTLHGHMGICRG